MSHTPAFTGTPRGGPLLEVKDLHVDFTTQRGMVSAVSGVDLTIMPGETVAIVGESGSGKSTTAHAIINLLPGTGRISGGQVLFEGNDLAAASRHEMEDVARDLVALGVPRAA